MGARGPKPLPTEIKQQRGTYRADRAPSHEAPVLGKPSCPAWMTDADARKEFRRVAKMLGEMGLVGAADSNLLTRYVTTWVRWRRIAQTLISNPGAEVATFKDEGGKIKAVQVSALHSIARSLADELNRCEAALGMSPSARSKIEVAPPAPPQADPRDRFFDAPMKIAQ